MVSAQSRGGLIGYAPQCRHERDCVTGVAGSDTVSKNREIRHALFLGLQWHMLASDSDRALACRHCCDLISGATDRVPSEGDPDQPSAEPREGRYPLVGVTSEGSTEREDVCHRIVPGRCLRARSSPFDVMNSSVWQGLLPVSESGGTQGASFSVFQGDSQYYFPAKYPPMK